MVLSRPFCAYLAAAPDNLPRTLLAYFANQQSSAEAFFQTSACASPFAPTLVNDDLRFLKWSGGKAQHPMLLTDAPELLQEMEASGALFARKFDDTEPRSASALDALDEYLRSTPAAARIAAVQARLSQVMEKPVCDHKVEIGCR